MWSDRHLPNVSLDLDACLTPSSLLPRLEGELESFLPKSPIADGFPDPIPSPPERRLGIFQSRRVALPEIGRRGTADVRAVAD